MFVQRHALTVSQLLPHVHISLTLYVVYYKLLLRSISAVVKAGSCLLFPHILAGSLRQTGHAVIMPCHHKWSDWRSLHGPWQLSPGQRSMRTVALTALFCGPRVRSGGPRLVWRGEVKSASRGRLSGWGSEWRSHCCQVRHSHSLSAGTTIH